MIDELHVQNLALIREAHLALSPGLTVLTGETGAGKTALLTALKLLCGERADATSVREGAPHLLVEGRVFLGSDADGIVASRRVAADGRSRASIDGAMASVRELSLEVGSSVDLCGQHEHQRLLKQANHAGMLEAWDAEAIAVAHGTYEAAFEEVKKAAEELARIEEASCASAAAVEEARFVLRRIDEVAPVAGEYDELAATLTRAENMESLTRAASQASGALAGDGGALDSLGEAIAAFETIRAVDAELGVYADTLREASYVVEDAAREAARYFDTMEFDFETLEELESRMAALQGLMRAYGPRVEDVLARREQAAEAVMLAESSDEHIAQAQAALQQAESRLVAAAAALDAARVAAAPRFAETVTAYMGKLNMPGAALVCAIEPLDREHWTKAGPSSVEFLFVPGEGMRPRPLARIASGGEVSRVMLAIKASLGAADDVETLVFDEVDAGVGGATAVALAGVLVELAKTHQVVVVTHLPQVAVCADAHFLVSKHVGVCEGAAESEAEPEAESRKESEVESGAVSEAAAIPETVISLLADDARVAEIARMLSGDNSSAALAHAEEMLANAVR